MSRSIHRLDTQINIQQGKGIAKGNRGVKRGNEEEKEMKLKIQDKDDGIWFVFESHGKHCAINIENSIPKTGIIQNAFMEWFNELWGENNLGGTGSNEAVFHLKLKEAAKL